MCAPDVRLEMFGEDVDVHQLEVEDMSASQAVTCPPWSPPRSPFIGKQRLDVDVSPWSFKRKLCRARTFGFMKDVKQLWAAGRALGASLQQTLTSPPNIFRLKNSAIHNHFVVFLGRKLWVAELSRAPLENGALEQGEMTLRFVGQTAVAITLAACLAGCGSTGSLNDNTRHSDIYNDAEFRSKRLACTSSTVRDADRGRDTASKFCPP
jgi:hypothetical protein